MSKVIPKEQLTAYQRWELASFEDGHDGLGVAQAAEGEAIGKVALPTAEEIEHIHQEAWREGYNLGLEEGRKAGLEVGRQAGEDYARQLGALVEALEAGRLSQDEEIAREILALALTVAQQVVRRAFVVKPELILEGIREALLSIPALNGHHKIATHPSHVDMVREWLAHEHGHLSWKVVADTQLEPGSFRFESSYSELDGSLLSRWKEITECLGVDDAWLS
ncbi:MAG TPA: flagellar assembly protein FliH [Thiobacillaceae bacterium]|nr:flagellar assembly protein FliH [Thiobacillaceae bacterium]HNA82163.1 flagellar assembly protein FliH [Thiobacillaceae bacterium]HNH88080.1 flagellar assembly protein FliH [Thiobacillaceae bacterium]HNI07147.1 flagellar assembly protein FliH [Thiobacillaceae bacterium]